MKSESPQNTFSMTGFREGKSGDFQYAYDMYYGKIYTFAYNLVGDETEAQDITTETFVKLWRLHENFESLNNIKAFLYITSRNACLDFLRHLKVKRKTHGDIRYSQKTEDLIPNEMISAEVLIELDHQIEQLPSKCRQVFKLIYYQNFNTSEVAQEMGISNQNVLNQKNRAVHIIRAALMQKAFLSFSLIIPILLFTYGGERPIASPTPLQQQIICLQ